MPVAGESPPDVMLLEADDELLFELTLLSEAFFDELLSSGFDDLSSASFSSALTRAS